VAERSRQHHAHQQSTHSRYRHFPRAPQIKNPDMPHQPVSNPNIQRSPQNIHHRRRQSLSRRRSKRRRKFPPTHPANKMWYPIHKKHPPEKVCYQLIPPHLPLLLAAPRPGHRAIYIITQSAPGGPTVAATKLPRCYTPRVYGDHQPKLARRCALDPNLRCCV